MGIIEKSYTIRYRSDSAPHIRVNAASCEFCRDKPCLYVCPVENFVLVGDRVEFSWDRCIECGACRVTCHGLGNKGVEWSYPRGGFGAHFRQG